MKMPTAALALSILTLVPLSAFAAEHGSGDAHLYQPGKIEWKDGPPSLPPGAKFAVLEGDPAKEGVFVMRVKLPEGFHVPAHTHPKHERVTILQGTFMLAMGENPKRENAETLTAGSYGVWPPGMIHAVWIEGETIIQVYGMGPWAINYVNPADDPRNKKK